MSEVVKARESAGRAELVRAYRIMLSARVLEEKLAALYRGGKIKGGVFLGKGQEALSVSVGIHLRKGARGSHRPVHLVGRVVAAHELDRGPSECRRRVPDDFLRTVGVAVERIRERRL